MTLNRNSDPKSNGRAKLKKKALPQALGAVFSDTTCVAGPVPAPLIPTSAATPILAPAAAVWTQSASLAPTSTASPNPTSVYAVWAQPVPSVPPPATGKTSTDALCVTRKRITDPQGNVTEELIVSVPTDVVSKAFDMAKSLGNAAKSVFKKVLPHAATALTTAVLMAPLPPSYAAPGAVAQQTQSEAKTTNIFSVLTHLVFPR
jgi:hypothetical protein